MKKLWVWVREDGEPPCLLQRGARPRGPGEVYEVEAATRAEAERTLALGLRPEPDADEDPAAWARWKACAKRIETVNLEKIDG